MPSSGTPVLASCFLGTTGQNYFYAMEFVEGETLEKLIKRSGPLKVNLVLEIVSHVAAGLAAIHKQKLVHRDIKPSNIMVSFEDGGDVTAKIINLGLAKPAPNRICDFNSRSFRWYTRVCQSRAVRRSGRRHPVRSVFTRRNALGNGDWPNTIPRSFR
jgi:serine/threonine protein kinase